MYHFKNAHLTMFKGNESCVQPTNARVLTWRSCDTKRAEKVICKMIVKKKKKVFIEKLFCFFLIL